MSTPRETKEQASATLAPESPSRRPAAPVPDVGNSLTHKRRIGLAERGAIPVVLVLLFIVFSVLSPHIFFTGSNVRVIIEGQATLLLLALAVTLPLRAGEFDLSVASVMVLSGCVVGVLSGQHHVPIGVSLLAAFLIGVVTGVVNAFFVVIVGVDALIATLGTMTVLTGIASAISGNNLVTGIPKALTSFAGYDFLGLTTPVWLGWLLAVILWYLYDFTPLGRFLLFVGGSRNAADLAGLRVARIRFGTFIGAGMISAIAGILLAGTLTAVDPSSGSAYVLAPYAAAFLGTATVQIGRFNVWGTVIGLYLLAVGIAGLQLLGVQAWIGDVFNGAALVLAVAFARYSGLLGRSRLMQSRRRSESTAARAGA
jgi:ribose transport system permease protein